MGGLDEHGVGGDPVALREDEHVAADHLAPGDAPPRPSRTTRARGLERSRSAARARSVLRSWTSVMPMTTTTNDDEDERLLEIAEQEVDRSGGEEQEEHRLLQHRGRAGEEPAPSVLRQLVRPLRPQAGRRLGLTQPHRQRPLVRP